MWEEEEGEGRDCQELLLLKRGLFTPPVVGTATRLPHHFLAQQMVRAEFRKSLYPQAHSANAQPITAPGVAPSLFLSICRQAKADLLRLWTLGGRHKEQRIDLTVSTFRFLPFFSGATTRGPFAIHSGRLLSFSPFLNSNAMRH